MSTIIHDRVAFVTGSNRGIGRALLTELLARGARRVYAAARNPDALHDLAAKHGDRLTVVPLDVTDPVQIRQAADSIESLDLLINNAGVALGGDVSDAATLEVARQEMEVNYFGLLAVSQAFTPALERDSGGAIVNIVSVGGLTNFPIFPTYSASKAAAHSLTQAQRALLAPRGIKVYGVYPGPVDTDMAKRLEMDKARPDEVAQAILNGVEGGQEDIFPDQMAEQFQSQYQASPKESERQVIAMVGA